MIQIIVEWYHEQLNHPLFSALWRSLKSHFYTWGLEQERVKKIYSDFQCDICSSNILLPKKPHSSHIKSLEIFERIQIDLTQIAFSDCAEILSKRGYRWVLSVLDCFSKYAWAFPLKSKETDRICLILCELFSNEGVPEILQSDNGGEFVSTIIRSLMPKLGIKLINGSPYSPTTQGQVERFNRTFKCLLRKEIQIELSKNNFSVVENWANILISRVIDSYRHKIHRSLSRTPWELYNNRTYPHPLKSSAYLLDPITSKDIEDCCTFPNLKSDLCISSSNLELKEAIRKHSDVREKLNISTLTQTRKVQIENNRKFKKNNVDVNFKLGAIAYMKNPSISSFRKKKNFLETMNIKVKILKKHFTSDQYQVEYINTKGFLKQTWVHKTELYVSNPTDIKDIAMDTGEATTTKFTIQDYNKLLSNFEQHIAEKWCNGRRMKNTLLREIQEDDRDQFSEFDSRQDKQGISNSFKYQGDLLFEILDCLFGQFCANAFSIHFNNDSSKVNTTLRYLAYKNFTDI